MKGFGKSYEEIMRSTKPLVAQCYLGNRGSLRTRAQLLAIQLEVIGSREESKAGE